MTLLNAKLLCSKQAAGVAWQFILDHAQSFIWSDDEEPVVTWNLQFGEALGSVRDERVPDREDLLKLSFRGRTAEVALQFNRDDRFRLLHGLAKVTRPDFDLRLCRDSTHSSDIAFLRCHSTIGKVWNPNLEQIRWLHVSSRWILHLMSLWRRHSPNLMFRRARWRQI